MFSALRLRDLMSRDHGLGGRGAHLVIPSIIGPILAAFLVFNRVYWRLALINALGYDDALILLSLVFLFAMCLVNLVAVDHGYGQPSSALSTDDIHSALQMFYLNQIFYKLTINLTKLSILALYLRIFCQRWFRITCLTCIAFVFTYAIASVLVTVFQCSPVSHVWDKTSTGTCINLTAFWYANAIYNILTDLVILLSIPGVVWSLHLPLRQRLGLTLVFGLGIFVFATSVLRFTTLDFSSKSTDATAGTLVSTLWTTIEASTAIVCACLPMVRTPLQRIWPRLFPTRSGSGTTNDDTLGSHGVSSSMVLKNGSIEQHDLELSAMTSVSTTPVPTPVTTHFANDLRMPTQKPATAVLPHTHRVDYKHFSSDTEGEGEGGKADTPETDWFAGSPVKSW